MKKEKYLEKLLSRREFFKKAAKGVLPILGLVVLGTSALTSCSKEEEPDSKNQSSSCNGCSGSCETGCSGDCDKGCSGNCGFNCTGQCWSNCNYAQY